MTDTHTAGGPSQPSKVISQEEPRTSDDDSDGKDQTHTVTVDASQCYNRFDTKLANEISWQVDDIPLKYRLMAFSLILLFSTGSAFAESTLGPLKSTLVKELDLNNAQFAGISTASNLVNTVLPLVAGSVMDYYGGLHGAAVSIAFCVVGSVIAACSANTGQYHLLITGRILMGCGSIVIESAQIKLYAHWFNGSLLASAIAIDLAWGSITTVAARAAAVPLSRIGGWYGWALWIPAIMTGVCALIIAAYAVLERRLVPREYRPVSGRDIVRGGGMSRAAAAFLNVLRIPSFYWMLCGVHLFQNSARTVFSSNLTDIQEKTRGTTALDAGYYTALLNSIAIVVAPALGFFFDKVGYRMPFVSVGALLYVLAFALLGFTKVYALVPILIASCALGCNVIPYIGSIPLLVNDPTLMGTAYGLWSTFIACNNVILEVACGAVQDATPGGGYERVMYVLIAIKGWQAVEGLVLDVLDGKLLGHVLRRSEKQRVALRDEMGKRGEEFVGWRVIRPVTIFFGGQYVVMVIVSWVLFFIYSVA